MRLLIVDHNALEPAHRAVYRLLAQRPGVFLRLLVPAHWYDNYRMLSLQKSADDANYEVVQSQVLFPTRTHRLIYMTLGKHLRQFRPDVLYMNAEPENFQTFQAALLHRSSPESKLVFSSWRNIDHRQVGYPYKLSALHNRIEKFVLKNADHCIAFNQSGKALFESHGFQNVTVIPPAVDLNMFQQANPSASMQQTCFRIGYLGRFVPEKGGDILLRAAALLRSEYKIVFVGDGPAKGVWAQAAGDLGIEDSVEWTGPVEPAGVPGFLSSLDVLVLPSVTKKYWKEQFGRALIEAMACGIPVIGSTSGEIPNVVGDAGLLFKEGDAAGLAACLAQLQGDPGLRAELSRKGLDRVQAHYGTDVVARQYYDLFRTLTQ